MSRPLVLLHGWGVGAQVWSTLAGALSGLTVHTPALPGHDDNPAPAAPTLPAWTDALAERLPDGATVCGWSLGALLALDLAARHPHKVARLVLIGATPRFVATAGWPDGLDTTTVENFRSAFADDPEAVLRRFVALQTLGDSARRRVGDALDGARVRPAAASPAHAALAAALALLATADLRDTLPAGACPLLLIHGEGDALMPAAAARWLAAHWPGARLEVLSGCGHAPFLSRPMECAALLRAFHEH